RSAAPVVGARQPAAGRRARRDDADLINADFQRGSVMRTDRRQFLHLAAGAAALPASSRIAGAQTTYPARPVHLICAYAAGGPNDITARLIAQWLSDRLGQQFVVD